MNPETFKIGEIFESVSWHRFEIAIEKAQSSEISKRMKKVFSQVTDERQIQIFHFISEIHIICQKLVKIFASKCYKTSVLDYCKN